MGIKKVAEQEGVGVHIYSICVGSVMVHDPTSSTTAGYTVVSMCVKEVVGYIDLFSFRAEH